MLGLKLIHVSKSGYWDDRDFGPLFANTYRLSHHWDLDMAK